jgi:hypothetical protein
MPYFYPIKDEHLRQLVMLSESINTLPEDDIQKMVTQIAALEGDAQKAMTATLEDEQRQIAAAKRAKGITPEMELEQIKENSTKLASIKRDFDMTVARENQNLESVASAAAAEDLLRDI